MSDNFPYRIVAVLLSATLACLAIAGSVVAANMLTPATASPPPIADASERVQVEYNLSYNLNGGNDSPIFADTVLEYDSARETHASISSDIPSRDGYEFRGWITRAPADCYLDPLVLSPGATLTNLELSTEQNAEEWNGFTPTLRSFANEDDNIELVAIWEDSETGDVDTDGIQMHKAEPLTSSTTHKKLMIASNGASNYHAYLYLEGTSPPSGWTARGSIGSVPISSSLPTYMFKRMGNTKEYYWSSDSETIALLKAPGTVWIYKGLSFYSDDAKGTHVYRFYKEGVDAGGATGATNWFSTSKTAQSGYSSVYENNDIWLLAFYNIAFSGNGATSGTMANMNTRQYGISYTLTANAFSRTGYTFNGWKGSNGGSYANKASVSNLAKSGTVTMTAQWKPITYTLNYNVNGATNGSNSSVTCTYDKSTKTRNNVSRTGYTLSGWNTAADGSGTKYGVNVDVKNLRSTAGTVTLYAQWSANPYTIAFSPNASDAVSGSMSNISAIYGTKYQLPECSYKRGKYDFVGWNTKADGTGTALKPGDTVSNLTSAKNGTVTLYAQWKTFLNIELAETDNGVTVSWTRYDHEGKELKIYRKDDDEDSGFSLIHREVSISDLLDEDASDKEEPIITDARLSQDGTIELSADDNGTVYSYYVESSNPSTSVTIDTSEPKNIEIKTGVVKYYFVCDDNEDTVLLSPDADGVHESPAGTPLDYSKYASGHSYIHIIAVDGAGNISETVTLPLPIMMPETGMPWIAWIHAMGFAILLVLAGMFCRREMRKD